jgi:[acyl-carrier-protein] S-malonyltransferase
MDRLGYIFPGQGSQSVGMGRALADHSVEARRAFEEADEALGSDSVALSRLCFEGPEEALRLTENTQPAILTVSIAAYRAFRAAGAPAPDFAAGHSLGEYSALVAAGVLGFADAVRLVRARGRAMQEAVPVGQGGMAAVLGADKEAVEALCEQAAAGEVCAPANFNCPGQIVIAGTSGAIERAQALARGLGIKRVKPLEVSAPFHCALMAPAAEVLGPLLEATEFRDPEFPVVANASAGLIRTGAAARSALVAQVASPVLWEQSVRTLLVLGVGRYVELGPGRVLSGLVRKVDESVNAVSAGTPEEVTSALDWLAGGSADTVGAGGS